MKNLPLNLLVDSAGRFLGDRFDITLSPGISYLNSARPWQGINQFSHAVITVTLTERGWRPLPQADLEAKSIATMFRSPRVISRDSLLSTDIPKEISIADIFHFSGHAAATIESVRLITGSVYLLNPTQVAAFRSGRVQLVVLSACATSIGTQGFFDDDDSMVRRLLAARVPDVIASRWVVDSVATSLLMESFYSSLLAGRTPSEALEKASQKIRSRPGYSHPYYWAGFSAFGRD